MADGTIAIDEPTAGATDKKVDTEQLTVSATTVQRERCQIAGSVDVEICDVTNTTPGGSDYGLVVREAGTVNVQEASALDCSGATITVTGDSGGSLTIDNTSIDNAHSEDYDTGAGTDTTTAFGIALPANGGAVAGGTTTNPIIIQEAAAMDVSAATVSVDWNGTAPPIGAGTEATALRVTLATDSTGVVSIDDNGGAITVDWAGTAPPIGAGTEAAALRVTVATDSTGVLSVDDNGSSITTDTAGDVAHDSADSGNPLKLGAKGVSHGTNPTEVANNDRTDLYANLAGVLFVMGGHPNVLTQQINVTAGDGAQTNTAIVSTTEKIAVTHITATCDNANSVDVQCRVGFGTTTTPANDAAGVILSHPGIAAGSGVSVGNGAGIIGVGGAGEDVRVTCSVPTGGSIDIVVTYFTIAS